MYLWVCVHAYVHMENVYGPSGCEQHPLNVGSAGLQDFYLLIIFPVQPSFCLSEKMKKTTDLEVAGEGSNEKNSTERDLMIYERVIVSVMGEARILSVKLEI